MKKVMMKVPPARKGSAAVELTLLLPIVIFLFAVAVDYSRIFYYAQTVENCAYAGVLYASGAAGGTNADPKVNAQNAAVYEGTSIGLTTSQVSYATYSDGNKNNYATVTVTYTFNTVIPFGDLVFGNTVFHIPSSKVITRSVSMRLTGPNGGTGGVRSGS